MMVIILFLIMKYLLMIFLPVRKSVDKLKSINVTMVVICLVDILIHGIVFLDDPMVIDHREMFSGKRERPTGVVEQNTANDVEAIACCVLFENVEDMWASYQLLKGDFTIVTYYTGLIRMDIYRKGYRKGTACQFLYQKLGIDQ